AVEGPGDTTEVMAVGRGHRRLVVGVARHDRRPVPAGAGQQRRLQPQGLGQEPLDRGPEAQQQDGGVEIVAGPARPQDAGGALAEPVGQPVLVQQVPAPPGLGGLERGEARRAQQLDLGQQGGGRRPVDEPLLGQHHEVGPVDLRRERELRRAGRLFAEHDSPGGRGEGAADAAGVVHAQPTATAGWSTSTSRSSSSRARARSAAVRAATPVGAALITWPTRSRKEPVPPTRWPGRASMATSTTPGTAAAAATPPVRRTRPAAGGTRNRIEAQPCGAQPGPGSARALPVPETAASTTAATRSIPVASRTSVGIRPPASRGFTSMTAGPSGPRRISVWAAPKPSPSARSAETATAPTASAPTASSPDPAEGSAGKSWPDSTNHGGPPRYLAVIPTTSVPNVSTDTSGPATYSSTSTTGSVGRPRSSRRCASSAPLWRHTSSAMAQRRTPRLPVPSAGFTTAGNPTPAAACTASSGLAATANDGTGTPAPASAARCRRLSRQRSTAPGSPPGSPSRVAALAVTATKYSELVTSPTQFRAAVETAPASAVSTRITSTSSSTTHG